MFKLVSEYKSNGDQPQAIEKLVEVCKQEKIDIMIDDYDNRTLKKIDGNIDLRKIKYD